MQGAVKLEWVTSSEKNNDYFEIQRSPDAISWEVINQVAGSGTTKSDITYQWVDENPFVKDNYYRLRQVDFDGTEEFHKIIWVTNEERFPAKLILYGNPIINYDLDFELANVDQSNPAEVSLIDLSGRIITSLRITSSGRKSVNVSGLPPGTYLLRAQVGDHMFIRRIRLEH